ncbi:hypothetical protein GCM10010431_48550 [Streptomyces kunmingensis]
MQEHKPNAQPDSGLEPVGVEGCATCEAVAYSRELAREADDRGAVASCNAEIENHPHTSVGEGRKLPIATVWGVRA